MTTPHDTPAPVAQGRIARWVYRTLCYQEPAASIHSIGCWLVWAGFVLAFMVLIG